MRMALTLAAAAAATWGVLAAPAGLASADQGAQNTITYWEQQGYQVNIDRVGSGPLQSCVVTSVRNPNTQTQLVRTGGRDNRPSFLVPVIISRTVQLSLYCANN
ncbi:MAG TPA: hypothetical protein VN959_20480 [Mycobacterium sp.]|jgi:hypothetical protein|nr:hypothetical protein [Mycobacterium sp.]